MKTYGGFGPVIARTIVRLREPKNTPNTRAVGPVASRGGRGVVTTKIKVKSVTREWFIL